MLTLPAELAATQGLVDDTRKPIIEVTAGRLTADFPLLGSTIANPDSKEQGVSASLFLTDGRYVILYAGYDTVGADELEQLRMVVSDSEVTQFNDYLAVYTDTSGRQISYLDTIVIDANTIGVVAQLGSDRLGLFTVSDAGVKLSEVQLTSLATLHGAAIVATDTGYGLIYIQEVSGTYSIYKRESADFITWGAATAVSISGLDSTHPLRDPRLIRLADLSYLLVYSYATVVTDDNDVFNLQYATSADLATWTATATITNDDTISGDYLAADVLQKVDGSLFIAAQRSQTYLEMTSTAVGWDAVGAIAPTNVYIDSAAGKLYITSLHTNAGTKALRGCCRVDIATWTIDVFYGADTVPALPAPVLTEPCFNSYEQGIGEGVATVHTDACVTTIDYNSDQVRHFCFSDLSASYGEEYRQNVNHDFSGYDLRASHVHDGKLWLRLYDSYLYTHPKAVLGYIDLSQQTEPYEFVAVNSMGGLASDAERFLEFTQFYPARGMALLFGTYWPLYSDFDLLVVSLEENAAIADICKSSYPDFPDQGVSEAVLIEDTIWAVPYFDPDNAEDVDKWGLMSIDLNSFHIEYYKPAWLNTGGNYFKDMQVDETATEILLRTADGVVVFNYILRSWERLENTNLVGLPPTVTTDNAYNLAYDPVRRVFVYGCDGHVFLVPREGVIDTIEYLTDDGSLVFGDPAQMVTSYLATAPSLAWDGEAVYASWTADATIAWDKESARLELGSYLLDGDAKPWRKSVLEAGSFTFEVSHGHLFDKHNDSSLIRPYLQKGRAVTIREGERIGGIDYWAEQGKYVITSVGVSYKTGEYPVCRVSCRDKSYLWANNYVPAFSVDSKTPEQALQQALTTYTDIPLEEIITPSMPLGFAFDLQLLDTPLADIVNEIAERFQHWVYVRPDDNIEFRPYNFDAAPSNTWLDGVVWDDSQTDENMTNRVVVSGKSVEDYMVTYAEERLASKSGTMGWWGCKNEHVIYWSDDKEKMARDIRLEVQESASSILFQLAGKVKESITEVDPYHKYAEVTIEAPSLVPLLLSAIGMYATGNAMGDTFAGVGSGWTVPVGRKIEGVGLMLGMMVLGSVANYQYELHGCPIGYVKRSYSAQADDAEMLAELGYAVREEFEGLLCHSQPHCQLVADFQRDLLVLQRKPVRIVHPRDLRDEPGDIVNVKHPITGVYKKVFIVEIERSHQVPERGSTSGGLLDTVSGWVIA